MSRATPKLTVILAVSDSAPCPEQALRLQRVDAEKVEVILARHGSGVTLGAALNSAAAAGRGEELLFLGEGAEPVGPNLLNGHLEWHATHPGERCAVVGNLTSRTRPPRTPQLRRREDVDPHSRRPVSRARGIEPNLFLDSAHMSLKRTLFERAGGFDERFSELAGPELGARLAKEGIELERCPTLLIARNGSIAPKGSFERSRAIGKEAALFRRLHPELLCPSRTRREPESLRGAALGAMAPILRALGGSSRVPAGVRERASAAMPEAAFLHAQRGALRQLRVSRAKASLALLAASLLALGALSAPTAMAAPDAPAWVITLTPMPANLPPGGQVEYLAVATNVGGKATAAASPTVVEVQLPAGLTPTAASATNTDRGAHPEPVCSIEVPTRTARCETTGVLSPGRILLTKVNAQVSPGAAGTLVAKASVAGGTGANQATATAPAPAQAGPVPFGYLPGFSAPANGADGSAVALAGSHPYQQNVNFGFPTEALGESLTNAGHARDFFVVLPRGMIGNPAASPVLCTEAELTSAKGCPDASQVGTSDVTTLVGETGLNGVASTNLYNMVPPPGYPAELATNVASVGIYVHALVSALSAKDYRVQTAVHDVLNFGQQPIFNIGAQIWGDPSSAAHNRMRGPCVKTDATCPVDPGTVPLLTTPGDCPGNPFAFEALTDSWEAPGKMLDASYESTDLEGHPVAMKACDELEFEPKVREARPSTDLTDSPAGFAFDLFQPQEEPHAQPLEGRATAILKDATVTFPAGLAVNPSQAAGLGACSEAQVGFKGQEEGALRFSEAPQSCPDAAKIGSFTATSPLLVRRDEKHTVELDPETGAPLAEPLHGSLYLATPFANPFGSLIAVYLVIEDEKTGIMAKLAGEGSLDPATGQITTRVKESPELPIEDVSVSVFGGDRGAFVTPPTCGPFETRADLTPWSAPEGKEAHAGASFALARAPGGGPCPSQASQMPNAPSMVAGTMQAAAGHYSPLHFKLSREDGSQRLARLEVTLPPGLTARPAGVAQCSPAAIERAISREHPEGGALELADPSCPASSEIGSVDVATGAGPHPFHVGGRAYLAGPYKDAPLSVVTITPAVAGPFDLGTVVVRASVYLDPETARPRTLTDPLPQLIDGVPADVRQITLRLDRPKFTLNPTSCDEESFTGAATSALGSIAPLSERFQVGGCKALPYKPKLTTRLFGGTNRGAHPSLRSVFVAKPGEANTARISFALPHSEFIDQAHFRTICTRVQFAAKACPAGSIYGHIKATTPLLDEPLEGPIYLRSSSHELPDVVAALHGPPSMPIEIDLDGRVDSVNGGVRTIFAAVPDAPVTKAIVTLQGKSKGLFQNSTNICSAKFRATLRLTGQNAKTSNTRPLLRASCPKKKKKAHGRR